MLNVRIDPDAMSDIGCNIASGIVAEQLVEKKITKTIIMINGLTLYRNFIGTLNGNTDVKIKLLKNQISLRRVIDLFLEDTKVFITAIMDAGVDPYIYIPNYKVISNKYKNFKIVKEFTGLKFFIETTLPGAMSKLSTSMSGIVTNTTHKLNYKNGMFIMTHVGFDLLNYVDKKNVNLIESHTGEIKDINKWYTKLTKIKNTDMRIIPFNEYTYQVFGDGHYVKSMPVSLRRHLYFLAKQHNWYSTMNLKEFKSSLKRADNVVYKELEKVLVRVYT